MLVLKEKRIIRLGLRHLRERRIPYDHATSLYQHPSLHPLLSLAFLHLDLTPVVWSSLLVHRRFYKALL